MPDTLFHNPYHFVPLSTIPGPGCLALQADPVTKSRSIMAPPAHLTHDRFADTTTVDGEAEAVFSGRVVCRMKVCELLAVGGKQKAGEKDRTQREVSLFKIGSRWAVPGSALRGLISSIAEAASNSAMRILENEPYSRSQGKGMARKQLGKSFEYFKKHFPESLPLHFDDGRSRLSVAEQLFGAVELLLENKQTPNHWKALAFAGRLRFSNALASSAVREFSGDQPVTQILDSPKPPSSAMYFQPASEGFIGKLEVHPSKHAPQGRKFYLHRKVIAPDDWVSRNPSDQPHQKAKVRPLTGGEFWFHIDFDNLSKLELELLCFALNPSDAFHHKLGMGKPLGLGKVKIEPAGIFLVDRTKRYAPAGFAAQRFHQLRRIAPAADWPSEYDTERAAQADAEAPSPAALRDAYIARIAASFSELAPILKAIQLIGDPNGIKHPVHYPQPWQRMKKRLASAQKGDKDETPAPVEGVEMERNSYEWFMANDQKAGQYLRPLTEANTGKFTALPALDRESRADAPAPPPPPPPPTDDQLIGSVHEFTIVRLDDGAKARFRVTLAGRTLTGKLADSGDFVRLPAGIALGGTVRLKLQRHVYPLWLLTLP